MKKKVVIGFCDSKWKPPRKSKLELQIEREDALHWSMREEPMSEYVHRPSNFQLTDTAKHVFGRGIHFINSMMP